MVNAQTWLESQEEYNTKEKRNKTKKITICYNDLEESLNLNEFVNLEELDCAWNELTNLELSNCQHLKELWCGSNQLNRLDLNGLTQLKKLECCDNLLSNFDYSLLNPNKITYLNISDNNLSEQDLSVFSKLVNLQTLWINNYNKEKIQQGIYNRWIGSLKPLKNLHKLKKLDISNTDIDSGLEYLFDSVNEVICSIKERPESAVKKIAKELVIYNNEIKNWRKDKYNFINKIRENERLLGIIFLINSALAASNSNSKRELTKEEKVLQILIFRLEDELKRTRKKLYSKKDIEYQLPSVEDFSVLEKKRENSRKTSLNHLPLNYQENCNASWKNINHNFTSELIKEWVRHGFTAEQCQEWINTNSSNQQKQAIQEIEYYVWLRDIKKVTAEWVLNYGNEQALKQEFFQWDRGQYQASQELNTMQNWKV